MSRTLSGILGADEPHFSHRIKDWERRSGQASHDVRLISDITALSKQTIREIGLDTDDTTPKELYYALIDRARSDSEYLASTLGISKRDTPHEMVKKIIRWTNLKSLDKDLWVIKASVIKSYLKKQPPKQLMKALGLRSVDSMLKRNDPSDLLALASLIEKSEWREKLLQQYRKLSPKDFQVVSATTHVVDKPKTDRLRHNGLRTTRILSPCYETGVVVVIPPSNRFDCDVLTITATLLETIADMRRRSAYFRLLGTESDFGKKVADVCQHGLGTASLSHNNFHWNPVHKHLLGNSEYMAGIEQPHLSQDDLSLSHAVDVLGSHDKRFKFWTGKDYVVYSQPNYFPVSLHLLDVSVNASNSQDYESAQFVYGQSRLWDELWSRYLGHEAISDEIVGSFFQKGPL